MLALINKATNTLDAYVVSTDGYDTSLYDVVQVPPGTASDWQWDGTQFVARPPTPGEDTASALASDPRWPAIQSASPAQIDSYLDANLTDLASARRMFKVLIMIVQMLSRSR